MIRLDKKYKTLLDSYGINTPLRIAHFMAQIEHESGLKPISENLNYSSKRLVEVFGRYFSGVNISLYAKKPERIANRVYANRMGNGNEASGEGWKYRGRGFIQITGKENYFRLHIDTDLDCVKNPDLLLEEANAMFSACWYWKKLNLNKYADRDDLDAISDLINIGKLTEREGDSNGYVDRKLKLEKWKKLLST